MIDPYSLYKRFPVEFDFSSEDAVIDSDSPSELRVMSARSTIVDTNTYTMRTYLMNGQDWYHVDEAFSLARDYLQGCYSDYVFFQANVSNRDSLYYLLIGDIDKDSSGFVLNDCVCTVFKFHNQYNSLSWGSANSTQYIRFPSLSLIDGTGSALETPYIQESIRIPHLYPNSTHDVSMYQIDINDDVLEYDEGYLYYTSFDGFPHLIEGVENYAFVAALVCFGVFVFKLVDRIFRRVY